MNLSNNLTQIVIAFITGVFAGGIAMRFISNRNSNNNKVTIKDNTTEGDIAGRDIKKREVK
jgi:uncharacterized membrane-anchored protein YhcB (DUF1043 family)